MQKKHRVLLLLHIVGVPALRFAARTRRRIRLLHFDSITQPVCPQAVDRILFHDFFFISMPAVSPISMPRLMLSPILM